MGLVLLGLGLLVFPALLLPLLLQAATMQAERIAAALRARLCLESQTGWDLTPGPPFSSYGIVTDQVSLVPSPSDTSACSLTSARPAESASCCSRAAKSASPYPR